MHEIFPLVTPIFTGLVALAVLFWLVWSDFEQTVIITATLLAHPLCPRVARDSCLTLLKELEATMSHDRIENILRDVRHEHRSLPYLPIGFRADPALSRSLMPLVDAILNG